MDSASLNFFSPILDGIDHWSELAPLLPVLILLELILSADNAVALASLTKTLNNIELQRRSLNIGITISLVFRIILILCANFIIKYSAVQIIASIYLLIIVLNKFTFTSDSQSDVTQDLNNSKTSFLRITLLLALTDLAFSIDSVTAAVAISDQLLLVITGAIIGVVALRFTADYFIRWLKIFINLENAGYLAVALVAIKLIAEVVFNDYKSFEYCFYCLLVIVFFWGFSQKNSIDDIS